MISNFEGKGRYEKLPKKLLEDFKSVLPLRFIRFETKGKYILIDLAKRKEKKSSAHMIIHLYMTGKLTQDFNKHSHYKFQMEDEKEEFNTFYYSDYRRFGYVKFFSDQSGPDSDIKAYQKILDGIAPPLVFGDNPLTSDQFVDKIKKMAKGRSKNVLLMSKIMDQKSICSGIGSYLIVEGFYRSKIYPWVTMDRLDKKDLLNLFYQLESSIKEGYTHHGMSLRDYADTKDKKGSYQKELKCYGRKTDDEGNKVIVMVNKKVKKGKPKRTRTPHGRTLHWVPCVQIVGAECDI